MTDKTSAIRARFDPYDEDLLEYQYDQTALRTRARASGRTPEEQAEADEQRKRLYADALTAQLRAERNQTGSHGPSRSRHNPYPSHNGRLLDDPANDWT
jgi:uncharacterized protein YaiI (UPF0178 family)